jgi:AAA domain
MRTFTTDELGVDQTIIPPRGPRFRLERFKNLKASTAPAYLVKGMLPRTGIVVIWGPPKCGKTFGTFDMVMHVAIGWEYRGRRVRHGTVIYFAAEGAPGLRARSEAWRKHHLADDPDRDVPFYLIDAGLDLARDANELIADIRAGLGATPPAIVVIDTLNRTIDGSESKDADMGRYLKAADAIHRAFDCLVIIVHHCGKDPKRPRGHTSLEGTADAQIAVTNDHGLITMTVEFMKDDEAGATTRSRLRLVELGLNDEKEPITSRVALPADDEAVPTGKSRKLTGYNKIGFDLLCELAASAGEVVSSNHIPPRTMSVDVELWRKYFHNGTIRPDIKDTSLDKAFTRAWKALKDLDLIGVWNGRVWVAGHADKPRTSAGQ